MCKPTEGASSTPPAAVAVTGVQVVHLRVDRRQKQKRRAFCVLTPTQDALRAVTAWQLLVSSTQSALSRQHLQKIGHICRASTKQAYARSRTDPTTKF
jgi:hypothetical protein